MLDDLYLYIKEFFDAGIINHHPTKQRNLRSPTRLTVSKSLFEHMTAGRGAEIRAQQALYPYLIERYPQTKPEFGFKKTRIDFFIPNIGPYNVAIELKHYSPHQSGQFKTLLGPSPGRNFTIVGDLKKARPPNTILLQIGLYTAVENATNPQNSSVQFVRTYVKKTVQQCGYEAAARVELSTWPYLRHYCTPNGIATPADFSVPQKPHRFGPSHDIVSGRVCFFMAYARHTGRLSASKRLGTTPLWVNHGTSARIEIDH